jgi:hypothetical protein
MMNFSGDPAGAVRLLQCGQESVSNAAAEDLATFVDITPYEWILVLATCSIVGTSTALTVKFVSSDASTGTSPVTAKDAAGTDLIATMATAADGTTVGLAVRTRGLKKWGSPQFQPTTAAMGIAYTILGIGPRDTAELAAGWTATTTATNSAGHAVVAVAEAGSLAP